MSIEEFSSFLCGDITAKELRLQLGIKRKRLLNSITADMKPASGLGHEIVLSPRHLEAVLLKFLNKKWTSSTLQDWASFILLEGTDIFIHPNIVNDDEDYYEGMWSIIQMLSSPETDGAITKDSVALHLEKLRKGYLNPHNKFKEMMNLYLNKFAEDSCSHIKHLFEHDELEMALESFILSAIDENISIPAESRNVLKALAVDLSLDKETVYRPDFMSFAKPFFEVGAIKAEELLPSSLLEKASFHCNEYAWRIEDLPEVIEAGKSIGLVSIGGQLQFRFPSATCECDWISIDLEKDERLNSLSQEDKVKKSAALAIEAINSLQREFDFLTEGRKAFSQQFNEFESSNGDITDAMFFVWYFEEVKDEAE